MVTLLCSFHFMLKICSLDRALNLKLGQILPWTILVFGSIIRATQVFCRFLFHPVLLLLILATNQPTFLITDK